jgi:copper chaperone CopZ
LATAKNKLKTFLTEKGLSSRKQAYDLYSFFYYNLKINKMKSISKILITIIVLLSFPLCNAQIKNQKTETVKIYGNCEMCESTIEKAGNLKSQSNVDWNKETKMATISYDSLKTSKEEILKRIALAGYDSDTFLAPKDTYSNLPSCCQYERAEQTIAKMEESEMEMTTNDHSIHSNKIDEMQDADPLSEVYDSYFAVKDALVKTDGAKASTRAKTLFTEINNVNMGKLSMDVHMTWMKVLENLKEDAEHIADIKDVGRQRDHFISLSKNIYEVMKISKQETPTYYQFCPMANDGKGANWLSKENAIKNPYYGSQMLNCGNTVETLKK